MELLIAFLVGGASSLGAAYVMGWRPGRRTWEERHKPAVVTFHKSLEKHIQRDTSDLEEQARSIVKVRDDSRETLSSLSRLLNSEIDKLSALLKDLNGVPPQNRGSVLDQIAKSISVLRKTWPEKEKQIEIELRKLAAEQGQREF